MSKFNKPPCKVGDIIYVIDIFEYPYQIAEMPVLEFEVDDDGFDTFTKYGIWGHGMWGLTLFLTREEAEQALKQMEEHNERTSFGSSC